MTRGAAYDELNLPQAAAAPAVDEGPSTRPASSESALVFRRLAIRRMAGFESGGFEIPDLSSGVNVIFGPNGCGKTQTARAISALLWREETQPSKRARGQTRAGGLRGASLGASLQLLSRLNKGLPVKGAALNSGDGAEDIWSIDLDAGDYRYQRGGADCAPPELPPADNRDRYTLPLHELLRSDDKELAEVVLRESAGGYDLARAVESLDFRASPQRGLSESKALKEAAEKVAAAEREQQDLCDQERQLDDLREQKRSLEGDRTRIELLDRAIDRARAGAQLAEARQALAAFPEAMKKLSGNELQTAQDLKQKLQQHAEARAAAEENLAAASHDMAACAMPHGDAPAASPVALDTVIAELADRAANLEKKDAELKKQIGDVESFKAARDRARSRIGSAITNQQLASLAGIGIGEVANLTRRAEKWRAEKSTLQSMEEWLGPAETPEDMDRLQRGVIHLSHWLRMAEPPEIAAAGPAPTPGSPVRMVGKTIVAILIIAVFGLLGVMLWKTGKSPWAMTAAGGALLVIVFAWLSRASNVSDVKARAAQAAADSARAAALATIEARRQVPLEQYMRLGLESPQEWVAAEVETLLENLSRRLARARVSTEKAMKLAGLASRRQQLENEQTQLLADYEAMRGRLGLQVRIDEASLSVLADNVSRWQDADQQVAATEAVESQLAFETHQMLSAANAALEPLGMKAEDTSQLRGIVDSLRVRLSNHQQAGARHDGCARNLLLLESEIADLSARQSALFDNLGLSEGDLLTLADWQRRLPEFHEAMRRLNLAENDWRRAEVAMNEVRQRALAAEIHLSGGQDDEPRDITALALGELESDRVQLQDRLRTYEVVHAEIVRIEDRLAQARKSRGLEEALCERDARRDALRRRREEDCDSAIGFLLAEHLRQETRDRSRPAVFRRAREIFARITQGRYTLEFDEGPQEGGQPSFRAVDRDSGAGLSLDELSSGSRLQLLLSVRVAFVEEQERGLKLPLIFDETLGNSDEQRARAIIEATIELARGGRQIFYFTAQPDEVGKWQGILQEQSDVAHRLIDLAAVRGLAETERLPLRDLARLPRIEIPKPDGRTRREYGLALKAPGFSPDHFRGDGDMGGVHLYHLVDDLDILYSLLRRGINTWGQWSSLVEHSAIILSPAQQKAFDRAGAAHRTLTALCRAWHVGRGKTVDRQVLIDSDQVGSAFIDRVAGLCESLHGDAKPLIEAMENRAIAGFRREKLTSLKTYLEEMGYLDARPVLDETALRDRVIQSVFSDLDRGTLTLEEVDQLIGSYAGFVDQKK